MSKPSCSLCAAYNALSSECRREAPKAIAVANGGQLQIIGAWPGTKPENWCLDFVADGAGETQQ